MTTTGTYRPHVSLRSAIGDKLSDVPSPRSFLSLEPCRAPVDVDAEITWRFPAEIRRVSNPPTGNLLSPCRKQGHFAGCASPTCNSADLKGTPRPPIPQYPSGFFARYCW